MKKLSVFIITTALLCSGFSNEGTWVIDQQSRLSIHGSTNLNNFTCEVLSYNGHDTLHYFRNGLADELQFTTNLMTIPIRSFDCGSKQISKDFWTTLKSDTYPQLDLNFISLQNASGKTNSVNGVMDISLAGVTTRYCIRFVRKSENGNTVLTGIHSVNFADFNLMAPEKLSGLIRVSQRLNVEFHLVLKSL